MLMPHRSLAHVVESDGVVFSPNFTLGDAEVVHVGSLAKTLKDVEVQEDLGALETGKYATAPVGSVGAPVKTHHKKAVTGKGVGSNTMVVSPPTSSPSTSTSESDAKKDGAKVGTNVGSKSEPFVASAGATACPAVASVGSKSDLNVDSPGGPKSDPPACIENMDGGDLLAHFCLGRLAALYKAG